MKKLLLGLLLVGLVGCGGVEHYPPPGSKSNTLQLINKWRSVIIEVNNVVRYNKDNGGARIEYDIYYRKEGQDKIYRMYLSGRSLTGLTERWAEDD